MLFKGKLKRNNEITKYRDSEITRYRNAASHQKETAPWNLLPERSSYIREIERLHFNLNLYTTGEFQLHQGINSLLCRAVDVNQTLI